MRVGQQSILVLLVFLPVLALGEVYTTPSAALRGNVAEAPMPLPATTPESSAETWMGVLKNYYAQRQNSSLWLRNGHLNANGQALLEALLHTHRWGLNPKDYSADAMVKRLQSNDPGAWAEIEWSLSRAFLSLASHLYHGRVDPAKADPDWFLPRPVFHPEPLLLAVARGKAVTELLENIQPSHRGYRDLLKGLHRFQALAAQGNWSEIPQGSKLLPGMTDKRIPEIRERLKITGELAAAAPVSLVAGRILRDDPLLLYSNALASSVRRFQSRYGPEVDRAIAPAPFVMGETPHDDPLLLYDEELASAVRRFQGRYGLEADAIIGPGTLMALNLSARERVRQIAINLERWRWLPRNLGDRYILVNMAGYELGVVEQGQPLWNMRVIVGKTYRKTPAFTQRLTQIVLNPYWNVPDRIAQEDLLPKLKKKPNFLKEQGIQVLGGPRSHANPDNIDEEPDSEESRGPVRLRQSPGPKNALGRIKFLLPNRFAIYLHDTPKRHLFDKTIRTFSSGCIRLEHPIELADFVLQDTPGWDAARVRAGIDSGKTIDIRVARPVPVYIVYLTAWLDADGVMQFRPDVYQRDQGLRKALLALFH